jgi:hypothetical protein
LKRSYDRPQFSTTLTDVTRAAHCSVSVGARTVL